MQARVDYSTFAGAKSLDISYAVSEFKRLCQEWANYDQNLHSVRIVHTRR